MNKWRASMAAFCLAFLAHSSAVQAEQEFTDLVAKVMPSIVNIAIEAMGQRVKLEQSGGDLVYATYVVEYVGAGSIVDPSGLIITNRHVVIPGLSDQNRCVQSRNPRDIMRQG